MSTRAPFYSDAGPRDVRNRRVNNFGAGGWPTVVDRARQRVVWELRTKQHKRGWSSAAAVAQRRELHRHVIGL